MLERPRLYRALAALTSLSSACALLPIRKDFFHLSRQPRLSNVSDIWLSHYIHWVLLKQLQHQSSALPNQLRYFPAYEDNGTTRWVTDCGHLWWHYYAKNKCLGWRKGYILELHSIQWLVEDFWKLCHLLDMVTWDVTEVVLKSM